MAYAAPDSSLAPIHQSKLIYGFQETYVDCVEASCFRSK